MMRLAPVSMRYGMLSVSDTKQYGVVGKVEWSVASVALEGYAEACKGEEMMLLTTVRWSDCYQEESREDSEMRA